MRDREGAQHGFSVPRGLLRPEVAERRRRLAQEVLPPVLAELVGATQDIFLQVQCGVGEAWRGQSRHGRLLRLVHACTSDKPD